MLLIFIKKLDNFTQAIFKLYRLRIYSKYIKHIIAAVIGSRCPFSCLVLFSNTVIELDDALWVSFGACAMNILYYYYYLAGTPKRASLDDIDDGIITTHSMKYHVYHTHTRMLQSQRVPMLARAVPRPEARRTRVARATFKDVSAADVFL